MSHPPNRRPIPNFRRQTSASNDVSPASQESVDRLSQQVIDLRERLIQSERQNAELLEVVRLLRLESQTFRMESIAFQEEIRALIAERLSSPAVNEEVNEEDDEGQATTKGFPEVNVGSGCSVY